MDPRYRAPEVAKTVIRRLRNPPEHRQPLRVIAGIHGTALPNLRSFLRRRHFVALGTVTIGMSVGIVLSLVTIIWATVLRPPSFPEPRQLRYLYAIASGRYVGITYEEYKAFVAGDDKFSGVLARAPNTAQMERGADFTLTQGEVVSANYFDVLRVAPLLGRGFIAGVDDTTTAPRSIVISHHLWEAYFDLRPSVLGAMLNLDGRAYSIIGVMGRDFAGTLAPWESSDYWVVLEQRATDYVCERPDFLESVSLLGIGRLNTGVAEASARAAVATRSLGMRRHLRPSTPDWTLVLREAPRVRLPFDRFGQTTSDGLSTSLYVIGTIVIVIAALNLSGLLVARSIERRRDLAVRFVLGATRLHVGLVVVQEALLLSVCGMALGVFIAALNTALFVQIIPTYFSSGAATMMTAVARDVRLGGQTMLFCALLVMLIAFVVGGMPAIRSATLAETPAQGLLFEHMTTNRRLQMHRYVVAPQLMLSLALLLVASGVGATVTKDELLGTGYDEDAFVYVGFRLPLPCRHERTPEVLEEYVAKRAHFNWRLLSLVEAADGVSAAALSSVLPWNTVNAQIIGEPSSTPTPQYRRISRADVSPRYFEVIGVPFVEGRPFSEHDTRDTVRVAILSQTAARLMWPGGRVVGARFAFHEPGSVVTPQWIEIVGVVTDVYGTASGTGRPEAHVYIPTTQGVHASWIIARGSKSTAGLISSLRENVRRASTMALVTSSRSAAEAVSAIRFPRRLAVILLGVSAMFSACLAALGLYGCTSFAVALRAHEIAIRTVVGARFRHIGVLVVKDIVGVLAVGLIGGIVGGMAISRVISHVFALVVVPAADVVVAVPTLFLTVVIVGALLPARKASSTDPAAVLRQL